jgi:hypothetical protein
MRFSLLVAVTIVIMGSVLARAGSPQLIRCDLGGFEAIGKHSVFYSDRWHPISADGTVEVSRNVSISRDAILKAELLYTYKLDAQGKLTATYFDHWDGGKEYVAKTADLARPTSYEGAGTSKFYLLPLDVPAQREGAPISIAIECHTIETE